MKGFSHKCSVCRIGVVLILLACALFFLTGSGRAEDIPCLSLSISFDQVPENLQYTQGEPVKLLMQIKNECGYPLYTDRGFSEVELHNSLVVTDPSGVPHILSEVVVVRDPPAPHFIKGQATSPAETLAADWVRGTIIDDLRELFPVMKTQMGWYVIEAHQPFTKYAGTFQDDTFGVISVITDSGNWNGVISSNKIQIQIVPGIETQGATLQIQLTDDKFQPLPQVPVKVFKTADIPVAYEPSDTWDKVTPVLDGVTDVGGVVIWTAASSYVPEDEYTVIAYYQNEYESMVVTSDDAGWTPGSAGTIAKQIVFGEPAVANKFSVFALNSIWIRQKAEILSGNVGVLNASSGPCLSPGVEIMIGSSARAENGVEIYGDTIKIMPKALVYNVFYNELENKGTILGTGTTPCDLPVNVTLPQILTVSPGADDVMVSPSKVMDLNPGDYGDVTIKPGGTLRLTGGAYHLRNLACESGSSLICGAPADIRIKDRLSTGPNVYLGPSPDSGRSAKDIVVYVAGINGRDGALRSNPKAAKIGLANEWKANIYVPDGTLWIEGGTGAEGSFFAKDVIVGIQTKVKLDSAF
jgi:hypothetical protein